MSKKRRRINPIIRGKCRTTMLQTRRKTIYKMTSKSNNGFVPCFVCGNHVKPNHATIEHIVPLSKGGTDDMENLSISHRDCNSRRGNANAPAGDN